MKNFFFAPSKATVESPAIADYLSSLGHIRFAEVIAKENENLLRRLKLSETRPDVSSIACILTAPTENDFLHGCSQIPVGRGITDIGQVALRLEIPTFICRSIENNWMFFPVTGFTKLGSTGNWKLDFSRAELSLPNTADVLFQ